MIILKSILSIFSKKSQNNYYYSYFESLRVGKIVIISDKRKHWDNVIVPLMKNSIKFGWKFFQQKNYYWESNADVFPKNIHLLRKFNFEIMNLVKILSLHEVDAVIVIEGDKDLDLITQAICQNQKIPVICIQWGAFYGELKKTFRDMPFDYFFSWGPLFSKQISPFNQKMIFRNVGYIKELLIKEKDPRKIVILSENLWDQEPKSKFSFIRELKNLSSYLVGHNILFRKHPDDQTDYKEIFKDSKIQVSSIQNLIEDIADANTVLVGTSSSAYEALMLGCNVYSIVNRLDETDPWHENQEFIKIFSYDNLRELVNLIKGPAINSSKLHVVCGHNAQRNFWANCSEIIKAKNQQH
jgi:hypothetical protein